MFIEEQGSSIITQGLYDSSSATFAQVGEFSSYTGSSNAVNRDGSLVWNGFAVMDRNFQVVQTFTDARGANGFNPVKDLFYAVDGATDKVIAYDTSTWLEQYRLSAGVDIPDTFSGKFQGCAMAFSNDGSKLFLAAPQGVSIVDLPQSDGKASSEQISGFPEFVKSGVQGQFTVKFLDTMGEPASNFRGKVHFASSDPTAILPGDYTFTAADAGSHAFTATLKRVGSQLLTATVVGGTLSATHSWITVHAPGVALIPVTGQQDLIFDPARNQLYITTSSGLLQRYDLATETLLAPWQVGGSLQSGDITPDGKYLYMTDIDNLAIRRVDLVTGRVTNITYGDVPWDLRICANGSALVTSSLPSGYGGLWPRQLDLATGVHTGLGDLGSLGKGSVIARSADYRTLFVEEEGSSSCTLALYDSAVSSFVATNETYQYLTGRNAVSRDGALVALWSWTRIKVVVMNRSFKPVQTFGNLTGGFAFDSTRDVFYGVDPDTDEVIAYDTGTWREKFRLRIGEDVEDAPGKFGSGMITVSQDDSKLFLATAEGVRVVGLPPSDGQAAAGEISGFPSFVKTGVQGSFTVSFRDAAGDLATQFHGTVHFTSSDPRALLPSDYSFTEAEGGSHDFTATLRTVGLQNITATVIGSSLTALQSDIIVHYANSPVIPVGAAAIVFDPIRNQLLITNGGGTLQRYDLKTETMLPGWQVGLSLLGADITPDGNYLYAADGTAEVIRRVNLDSGEVTTLPYSAWDVKVAADGQSLFTDNMTRVDLTAGTSLHNGSVGYYSNSIVVRSADRCTLFIEEQGLSSGHVALYDPRSDSLIAVRDLDSYLYGFNAVSRDGSFVALRNYGIKVMDRTLTTVHAFSGLGGGFGFSPVQDLFYLIDPDTDQAIAYDAYTWKERYRLDAGVDVEASASNGFGYGFMTFSDDGARMFLSTSEGVVILDLPQSDGNASSGTVDGFPTFVKDWRAGNIHAQLARCRWFGGNRFPGDRALYQHRSECNSARGLHLHGRGPGKPYICSDAAERRHLEHHCSSRGRLCDCCTDGYRCPRSVRLPCAVDRAAGPDLRSDARHPLHHDLEWLTPAL